MYIQEISPQNSRLYPIADPAIDPVIDSDAESVSHDVPYFTQPGGNARASAHGKKRNPLARVWRSKPIQSVLPKSARKDARPADPEGSPSSSVPGMPRSVPGVVAVAFDGGRESTPDGAASQKRDKVLAKARQHACAGADRLLDSLVLTYAQAAAPATALSRFDRWRHSASARLPDSNVVRTARQHLTRPTRAEKTALEMDTFHNAARQLWASMDPDSTSGMAAVDLYQRVFVQALRKRSNDDLGALARAAASNEMEGDITCARSGGYAMGRDLLAAVRAAVREEQEFRYQETPLQGLAKLGKPPTISAGLDVRPDHYQIASQITRFVAAIFRGMHEGLPQQGEFRSAYLSRIMTQHVSMEDRAVLRGLLMAGGGRTEVAEALIAAVAKDAQTDGMGSQYARLVREMRALLADNALMPGEQQTPAASLPRPWPGGEMGDVRPDYDAGWLRKLAAGARRWGAYLVGSGEYRARTRIAYLESNLERSVASVSNGLSRFDGDTSGRVEIEHKLGRLHEAADALQVELSRQQSSRRAADHVSEAILRTFGKLGEASLKSIWRPLLEQDWHPAGPPASSAWYVRAGRRVRSHWRNVFHDARATARLNENRDGGMRARETWRTFGTLLEKAVLAREASLAVTRLAQSQRERNYGKVAEAVRDLIVLDSRYAGDAGVAPVWLGLALKQLDKSALDTLMVRLARHSGTSGKSMIDYLKPDDVTLPQQDKWFMAQMLEYLYAAGRAQGWAAPVSPVAGTPGSSGTDSGSSSGDDADSRSDSTGVSVAAGAGAILANAVATNMPRQVMTGMRTGTP